MRAALFFLFLLLLASFPAEAQRLLVVRDSETEELLRSFLRPLFKTAGLDVSQMRVVLVKDDTINAFTMSGLNVFVHTGLLMKADSASEVIGVLAHETGHIAGGHTVRMKEHYERAQNIALISMILGSLAAVASSNPEAMVAGSLAGMHTAERMFLSYRRSEEQSADQMAIGYLKATKQSPSGLLRMMKEFERQERLLSRGIDPYAVTHPMSMERMQFLQANMFDVPETMRDQINEERFQRIKAKLTGFLAPLDRVRGIYGTDTTIAGRYAMAVYYFRRADLKKAVELMDALIAEEPDNAFFLEQKGQILFEMGKVKEAVIPYQKASYLRPRDPQIKTALAWARIESGADASLLVATAEEMAAVVAQDPNNVTAWRLYAICYGRSGNEALANYGMAEYNFLLGRYDLALQQAKRGLGGVPTGSPVWIRLQDIQEVTQEAMRKEKMK